MKKHKPSRRKPPTKPRPARRPQSGPGGAVGAAQGTEWVGGRVLAPVFIQDELPYRPVLEMWVADGYVIHVEIYDPKRPMAPVSEGLRARLRDPPIGDRPRRLRLSDPEWAAQVRRVLPGLDVISGPTPELDDPLAELTARMAEGPPTSYLDNRLSAEDVAALFAAAAALYRLAPWKVLDDDQIIEVNIPEFDVHGACLSIIGSLGESFGMILFGSLADYERMLELSAELEASGDLDKIDFDMTALNYERGADLPPGLRREVKRHGWPVATAAAYPVVQHRGPGGLARPVTPRELHVITACAEALVSALEQHQDASATRALPHLSRSHVDRRGVEVQLQSPPHGQRRGGGAGDDSPSNLEQLEETLLVRLFDYGHGRWGSRFTDRVIRLLRDQTEAPLLSRVGAFHLAVDGERTVADCFLDDRAPSLDAAMRRLLAAEQVAWLSLWQLQHVVVGESVTLRDLLTGDTCRVRYTSAFDGVPEDAVLLARVLPCDGETLLSAHPLALSMAAAVEVAAQMRKYLRTRSAVAPNRLRHPNSVRYLLKRWQDMIEEVQPSPGESSPSNREPGTASALSGTASTDSPSG